MQSAVALLLLASTTGAGQNGGWVIRSVETKSLRPTATADAKREAPTLSEAERNHIIAMYRHAAAMKDYAGDYGHVMHGHRAVANNFGRLESLIEGGASYCTIVQQYEKTHESYVKWKSRHDSQSIVGRNASITRPFKLSPGNGR